jgi:Flp pilus assembly protein TadD
MKPASDPIDPETVRCPTCRASQPWSDACRRCKSDLRLLREFARAYDQAHREGLDRLRESRSLEAWETARRCVEISPDARSRRLLALAALQAGDWATAASIGRSID